MPYKDDIYERLYIMDKWHKVRVLYLWFYWIKNLVDDQFNNIGVAITNSEENIDINVMNTNKKSSKSIPPSTPPCLTSGFQEKENYNIPEDEDEENIK